MLLGFLFYFCFALFSLLRYQITFACDLPAFHYRSSALLLLFCCFRDFILGFCDNCGPDHLCEFRLCFVFFVCTARRLPIIHTDGSFVGVYFLFALCRPTRVGTASELNSQQMCYGRPTNKGTYVCGAGRENNTVNSQKIFRKKKGWPRSHRNQGGGA